jgi:Flp pilus assembly protein TadB
MILIPLSVSFFLLFICFTGIWRVVTGEESLHTNGKKRLKEMQKQQRMRNKISPWEKEPLQKLLTYVGNHIVMEEDHERKEEEQLKRVGLNYTARQFEAKKVVFAICGLLFSFFLYFIGLVILAPIGLVVSVLLYFGVRDELADCMSKQNEPILQSLPPFILAVISNLKTDRDIISIIDRYIPFSEAGLKRELEKLVVEMKTSSIGAGLKSFDNRMSLSQITRLVNILVQLNRGIDQTEALKNLSDDMLLLTDDNITKILSTRPQKLRATLYPATILAAIELFYALFVSIPNHLILS